jgi:hypothetical protein
MSEPASRDVSATRTSGDSPRTCANVTTPEWSLRGRSSRGERPPAPPRGMRRRSGHLCAVAVVVVIAMRRARLCGRRGRSGRARRVGARAAAAGGNRNARAAYCQHRRGAGEQSGMPGWEHGEPPFGCGSVLPRSNRDGLRAAEDRSKKLVKLPRPAGARACATVAASRGPRLLRRPAPRRR